MPTDPIDYPRSAGTGRSFAARVARWLSADSGPHDEPVEHQGSWLVITPAGRPEASAGSLRAIRPHASAHG
jgi:hypothetical protein